MRRTFFLSGLLTVALTACQETSIGDAGQAGAGEVEIALTSTESPGLLSTRSEEEELPDVSDFIVEIYSASGIRLYRDTYANSSGKTILLNSGEYRLLAQHGDSAGVGFNSVWFAADRQFTVRPQTHETVEAVARMSKVKVAVEYGPQISLDYSEFYVEITSDVSEPLTFSKDETRAGYMPAATLTPLVYAVVDGELKYYRAASVECSPNDFVTFSIDTKPLESSMNVSVSIDRGTETIVKDLTIPSDMMPKDGPQVSMRGFESGTVQTFTEALDSPLLQTGLRADIVADGKIACCSIEFEPETASSLGVPVSVDLCSADQGTLDRLEASGFRWLRAMGGQRLGYVDFTGVARGIVSSHCVPSSLRTLSFRIAVTDSREKTFTSELYTIAEQAPSVVFEPQDWNAYARRIDHLTASVPVGNPDALELQYMDSGEWKPVEKSSFSASEYSFNAITGLQPSTQYQLRAIYNGNEAISVNATLTTESDAQIGNSGLEDWQTLEHQFTYNFFGKHSYPVNWDLPWVSDGQWWAVNSKLTMPSSTSVASANWNWVRFPSVSWTDDCTEGSKAAVLYGLNVGDWVTASAAVGQRVAGEFFIGKADDSGNHQEDGHAFGSRPDKLKFDYKYDAYGSETFSVTVLLTSADGVELFSGTRLVDENLEWTEYEFPLTYSFPDKKVGRIYVSFKASTAEKPGVTGNYELTIRNNEKFTGNFGSILKIDNIELIYE